MVATDVTSTTDVDSRVLFTRLTSRSDGGDTGEVTREGGTHTTDTCCTFKHFTRGLGDSTHHRGFFLLAVAYHHDFLKLGILSERNIELTLLANLDFLRGHTYIGNHQH